ncbi:MAG: GNAT family N-acetyltransferase [Geminicoccaceae bacterium]
MTVEDVGIRISIEAFDPAIHDRREFQSGVAQIDNFLRLNAKKQQRDGMTRVWIAVETDSSKVIGYYALNAVSLDANDLPDPLRKRAPGHGTVPGVILSMIGVHIEYQGQGIGRVLMADARQRVEDISKQIGLAVLVLDVLKDGNPDAVEKRRQFYVARGYQPLPSRPERMFRVIV